MRKISKAVLLGALGASMAHCSTSESTSGPPGPAPPDRDAGSPDPTTLTCEAKPEPHCAHPIDHLLVPMYRAANVPIRDAGAREICRRMAVDLIGRIPTVEEADACARQTPSQMADTFMAMPEYVVAQARTWGELLGYDLNFKNWYGDVLDLDAIVRRAYAPATRLAYSELAARAVVHPAFYTTHQGDDWAAGIFNVFLGRAARPDEIAGMRVLLPIWANRIACDGRLWFIANRNGNGDSFCSENGILAIEWAANFCSCTPAQNNIPCRTSALGATVDFGSDGCRLPMDPTNEQNFVRLGDRVALGLHDDRCGDGVHRAECRDRAYALDATGQHLLLAGPLAALPQPSAPQAARLHQIGDALAARPDFWEAAADRELRRFMSWWKDGTRRPDYDVPEVRAVVSRELQKGNDLPAIQKLIVTSLLYVAPAEPSAEVAKPPLWSMGPTKLLASEAWLDSAAMVALGESLGVCDYRFVAGGLTQINDNGTFPFVDPEVVVRVPSPLAMKGFTSDDYYTAAQQLGGCSADGARPRISSVGIVYAQHDLAKMLSAYGPKIVPSMSLDGSQASLEAAAAYVVRRLLSREASAEEKAALAKDMADCIAAGPTNGCETPEIAVRALARDILEQADFSTY